MRKEDCFYLGNVSKTYSFRGELVIYIDDRSPERFTELESVYVEINNKLVPFFIHHIRFDRKGAFARVKFQGVDTAEDAAVLVKKDLYLPRTLQNDEENDEFFPEDVIGFSVIDEQLGDLGAVSDFIDHPTNPILRVSGDKGEILIPFQDTFIVEIDDEESTITVDIPEGLIGLNA